MRIEEAFQAFNEVLWYYDKSLTDLNYLISESARKDYLVCDLPSRIAYKTGAYIMTVAEHFQHNLPFETEITKAGDLEFYLWQEVRK